ncbi:ABC transporter, putative [Bodo saltans]|uniref:ABC transporter, putative n=1 Tax=Bodo saltans TaxID=75058 RepID=A0A0S4IW77_BODSA|nr:ABC transporter, putative [Bodo saltans]|eukprot:CUG06065.1 ABC transporter, putative [Bodo saltans]
MTTKRFQVELGLNQSSTPSTLTVRQRFSGGLGSEPYGTYYIGGFITLEVLIESYYLSQVLNIDGNTVQTYSTNLVAVPMPYGKYRNSAFLTIAGNISPLVLVLAFLYPVSQLAKRIVEEKESRLREGYN